jgi:hypothetical protein
MKQFIEIGKRQSYMQKCSHEHVTKYVAIFSSWTLLVAQKHHFLAEVFATEGVSVYTWAMVEQSPEKQRLFKNVSVKTLATVGEDTSFLGVDTTLIWVV